MANLTVNNTCILCGKIIDDDETMYIIKRGKLTNISYCIPKNVYVDPNGNTHDEFPARLSIGERYLKSRLVYVPQLMTGNKRRVIYSSGKNGTRAAHQKCMEERLCASIS